MNLKQAAEMALEALMEKGEHHQKVYRAAEALRQALAQPERKWVGLTKEEAREISLANRPYVVDMIAALEAKLKEKNPWSAAKEIVNKGATAHLERRV